jgi:ribosomal protein L37AE/L43A
MPKKEKDKEVPEVWLFTCCKCGSQVPCNQGLVGLSEPVACPFCGAMNFSITLHLSAKVSPILNPDLKQNQERSEGEPNPRIRRDPDWTEAKEQDTKEKMGTDEGWGEGEGQPRYPMDKKWIKSKEVESLSEEENVLTDVADCPNCGTSEVEMGADKHWHCKKCGKDLGLWPVVYVKQSKSWWTQ